MRVTLKGNVVKVSQPRQAGENKVTDINLKKMSYDSETGKLRSDDVYPIQIWENDLSAFKKVFEVSPKMQIDCYLNGRLSVSATKETAFLSLTGKKFETIK